MAIPAPQIADPNAEFDTKWSKLGLVLFRFVFAYIVLNRVIGTISPYFVWPTNFEGYLRRIIFVLTPVGFGDSVPGLVVIFGSIGVAAISAVIWTQLDRKRTNYDRLYDWLRVYVRFTLAATMFIYGAIKVLPSQFPPPSPSDLIMPFGDATPMQLLWIFMGASPAYSVFGGFMELIGGLFLTTRHTTLLGALLCVTVLTNVVALNLFYDVSVKLFSIHLLLMAIFLTAPDVKRLFDFFVRGRAVGPTELRPLFQDKRRDRMARIVRTLFVALTIILCFYQSYQSRHNFGRIALSPLYGVWTVDEWDVGGKAQPLLVTDASQWHRIALLYRTTLTIVDMSGDRQYYDAHLNRFAKTLTLKHYDKPRWTSTLTYGQPQPGILLLSGTLNGQQVTIRLHREDTSSYTLVRHDFSWTD